MKGVKYLFLFVVYFQVFDLIHAFIVDKDFHYAQCETLCLASGGKGEYDSKTELCKCILTKTADDTDVALIKKNANLIGKQLESVRPINRGTVIIKREISKNATLDIPSTTTLPQVTTVIPDEVAKTTTCASTESGDVGGIVGQQAPNPPRRLHNQRVPGQRRQREPRPITLEQQRIIIQQMREHLNRLSLSSEQRIRQLEIDGLRGNLRQLSQTLLVQAPHQRTRLRTAEDLRRRQRQRLVQPQRIVGATHNENVTTATVGGELGHSTHENEVEAAVILHKNSKKVHPKFEIITQDPRLVDEE